jgi:hypothetical protein
MSGVAKKLMSAAGAGGGFTAIEDVFSTYLYTGNNTLKRSPMELTLLAKVGLFGYKREMIAQIVILMLLTQNVDLQNT